MPDDKIVQFMMDVSAKLGSIESKLSSVCESLLAHEGRITRLEQEVGSLKHASPKEDNWKNALLMLLAKSVLVGAASLATLSGASKILEKFIP